MCSLLLISFNTRLTIFWDSKKYFNNEIRVEHRHLFRSAMVSLTCSCVHIFRSIIIEGCETLSGDGLFSDNVSPSFHGDGESLVHEQERVLDHRILQGVRLLCTCLNSYVQDKKG